jgi:hypothetical protein
MSAVILPFPINRRYNFIARQVRRLFELHAYSRERHICLQLKIQADAMRRKGIADNLVARELKSMEFAVRKGLSRGFATPFGAT